MKNYVDEYPEFTEVVTWPDSQMIPEKEGALENCALINSYHGLDIYGSSAYRVNPEWYQKLINGELNEMSAAERKEWQEGNMNVDTTFPFEDDEEEEHICPKCGSTNCRSYLNITECGDEEGYICEDCRYEGSEEEFMI